jgi:hypothetical protein
VGTPDWRKERKTRPEEKRLSWHMDMRRSVRVISIVLLVLLGATYIAAKVHFFRRYFVISGEVYFHEHRVYWETMAGIALVMVILEKLFPEKDIERHGT